MNKLLLVGVLCTAFSLPVALSASEKADDKEEATTATAEVAATNEAVRSGKEVYESLCMVCHVSKGKPTIAPPIFAVKNHVIEAHPEREDFVQRIVDWVKKPDADNALMRGAIKKFGLMPPMPQIDDEELLAVAEFLYDTDVELPDWYKKHYKEEHGKEPETHKHKHKAKE